MEKSIDSSLDIIINTFRKYTTIEKYTIINDNNIKIYSNEYDRRGLLNIISSNEFDFEYKSNMRHSSIGGLIYQKKYRIFLKPYKTTSLKLLPTSLKLTNKKYYNISEYYIDVIQSIKHSISNVEIQLSLQNIVKHYANDSIIDTSMFSSIDWKHTYPLNSLNNQFGEIIGPFACISKGYTMPGTIFFPDLHNYPLIDYEIGNDKISQKSSNTPNTIKISDLSNLDINLLKNNPELEEISSNPVKIGAYLYSRHLRNNGISYFDDFDKEILSMEELYFLEKRIEKYTKEEKDYTMDVINILENKIRYMYFESTIKQNNLFLHFNEIGMNEFRRRKLYLKSKNSTKRFKDKLGFALCNI